MSLYEATFIIRQDLSTADVEKLTGELKEIVTADKGKIVKEESWGLRSLAYKINKSKKGHYVFLGLDASGETIAELTRKAGLNEDVVRNLIIKVEDISKEPSRILSEDTTTRTRRAA